MLHVHVTLVGKKEHYLALQEFINVAVYHYVIIHHA